MSDAAIYSEITIGLGQYLDGAGVGVWLDVGAFDPSDVPITFGAIPQEFPRAIGLTPYPVSGDRQMGIGILGVQIVIRAASPVELVDLRGAIKEALDGVWDVNAGGHVLPLIWWSSGADLSEDHGRTFESSDNYYLHYSQAER